MGLHFSNPGKFRFLFSYLWKSETLPGQENALWRDSVLDPVLAVTSGAGHGAGRTAAADGAGFGHVHRRRLEVLQSF